MAQNTSRRDQPGPQHAPGRPQRADHPEQRRDRVASPARHRPAAGAAPRRTASKPSTAQTGTTRKNSTSSRGSPPGSATPRIWRRVEGPVPGRDRRQVPGDEDRPPPAAAVSSSRRQRRSTPTRSTGSSHSAADQAAGQHRQIGEVRTPASETERLGPPLHLAGLVAGRAPPPGCRAACRPARRASAAPPRRCTRRRQQGQHAGQVLEHGLGWPPGRPGTRRTPSRRTASSSRSRIIWCTLLIDTSSRSATSGRVSQPAGSVGPASSHRCHWSGYGIGHPTTLPRRRRRRHPTRRHLRRATRGWRPVGTPAVASCSTVTLGHIDCLPMDTTGRRHVAGLADRRALPHPRSRGPWRHGDRLHRHRRAARAHRRAQDHPPGAGAGRPAQASSTGSPTRRRPSPG